VKILIHTPISNREWCLPHFWERVCQQIEHLKQVCNGAEVEAIMRFDVNDSTDKTLEMVRTYAASLRPFRAVQVGGWMWPPLNLPDHQWNEERYYRMIRMRNAALHIATEFDCDYLFSLDSDVMLEEKDTLAHLIADDVPIIAGVFFSKWGNAKAQALPNVWQKGQNEMTDEFLDGISTAPDHVKVGGLGACTLIKSKIWKRGVNYNPIYNLPSGYRGEDRQFCIRVAVAGFSMWACAHKKITHLDSKEALLTQTK